MTQHLGPYAAAFEVGVSYSVGVAPFGSVVATTHASKIQLWDPAAKETVAAIALRHSSGVSLSPDGRVLAAMSTTGAGLVFDVDRRTETARFSGRGFGEGSAPIIGPCGTRLVLATWKGDLVVRAVEGAEVVLHEREPQCRISQLACSPDRTVFAYLEERGAQITIAFRRWPFEEHQPHAAITLTGPPWPKAIALDGHGRLAVRERERLTVWDVEAGACVAERPMNASGTQEALLWLPDGQLVATDNDEPLGGTAKRVVLFGSDLTEEASLPVPDACSLACSESGELLALGSWEKGLVLRRKT